jgi:hypothetical protein
MGHPFWRLSIVETLLELELAFDAIDKSELRGRCCEADEADEADEAIEPIVSLDRVLKPMMVSLTRSTYSMTLLECRFRRGSFGPDNFLHTAVPTVIEFSSSS